MARSRVRVRDLGFDAVLRRLRSVGGTHITVGVHGDVGARPGGQSAIMVASVHEFGSSDGRIPQRSYIRSTIDGRRADIGKVVEKVLGRVTDRKLTAEQGSEIVGQWVTAAIQKKITDGDPDWEPLAASTIARKGSTKPLLDKGHLRAAITHRVVRGRPPRGGV